MEKILYNVSKSYLEMARAPLRANFKYNNSATQKPSSDTFLALVSMTYIYSHMAIQAFVSGQLHSLWEKQDSELKNKFHDCESFEKLMKSKLKLLKVALRELCCQLKIQPIDIKEPKLWQEFNKFLKKSRDFFVHPDPDRFNEFLVISMEQKTWGFASDVASRIIKYFFENTAKEIPDWLEKNTDFIIPEVKILD